MPASATDLIRLRVATWDDLKLDNFGKLGATSWKRPGFARSNSGHQNLWDPSKAGKRKKGIAGKMKERGDW